MRLFLNAVVMSLLVACGGDSDLQLGQERMSDAEAQDTADMIAAIKAVSLQRHPEGIIKRFNQHKTLGCFAATFTVNNGLEARLRQGIFASERSYPALLRFASATKEDDREKDFRGLSIKLSDVPGDSLWGESGEQDFVLNSYPALFAANPGDFRDFVSAAQDDALWRYFIHPAHWYSLGVVLRGREAIDNPLAINYWSTTPYRLGNDPATAVKYSVRPCKLVTEGHEQAAEIERHRHFLSQAMRRQLRREPACLDFMVQFQTDPERMPIENAAVTWDESSSPFIKVARILIDRQPRETEDPVDCEATTFNPWQSLAAHQPLGGINRARRPIYAEVGEFRERENLLRKTE